MFFFGEGEGEGKGGRFSRHPYTCAYMDETGDEVVSEAVYRFMGGSQCPLIWSGFTSA